MNSLHMYSNDGVYSFFFFLLLLLFSALVLSISSMYAFYSLVHRSVGYLKGKRKRISLTFYLSLFLLADAVMLVIICVHRRSSILSFGSKVVVVMRFFLAFVLFVFCFFFFSFFFFSFSRVCSLFLTKKTTKRYHYHILLLLEWLYDIFSFCRGFFSRDANNNRKEREKEKNDNRKNRGL
jgi:hypothetical protein